MAKIVRDFNKIQRFVQAYSYADGSLAITTSYIFAEQEQSYLFHKLELSPEGVKNLVDLLTRVAEQRDGAVQPQHSGLDQKQEFMNCPNCDVARLVADGVVTRCPNCGDDEIELLLEEDVP